MKAKGSVDVVVYETQSSSVKTRTLLQRPISTDSAGVAHVVFDGLGYPLWWSDIDGVISFECDHVSVRQAQFQPLTPGAFVDLPDEHGELNKLLKVIGLRWKVRLSQFGHILEVVCDESVIIDLVDGMLRSPVPLKIIDWGDVNEPTEGGAGGNWQVRVAPGISARFLSHSVAIILKNKLSSFLGEVIAARAGARPNHGEILNELRQEAESYKQMARELQIKLSQAQSADFEATTPNRDLAESSNQAVRLKRNESHKLVANAMYGAFNNLAFDPDSVSTIIKRFVGSYDLWSTLSDLNTHSGSVTFEALHGPAGKRSWREVRKHVSTGSDNRGRIYARKSKSNFAFEVAVHWKQNEAEQNRFMKRLAKLDAFGSRKVIFG